jgi:hypothetical protein
MSDIQTALDALNRKGFNAVYAADADAAKDIVMSLIADTDSVGAGGSITLDEIGLLDALADSGRTVYSTILAGRRGGDKEEARRLGVTADVYVSSTNALTLEGDLINIDGSGNRVAGMIYGPQKVIIVAGRNKLTKNPHTAIARIKKEACPPNARRLGLDTPCGIQGVCTDCDSPQRMCNVVVRIQRPPIGKEYHVILIDGDFGY